DVADDIWPIEVDLGELEIALLNIAVDAHAGIAYRQQQFASRGSVADIDFQLADVRYCIALIHRDVQQGDFQLCQIDFDRPDVIRDIHLHRDVTAQRS